MGGGCDGEWKLLSCCDLQRGVEMSPEAHKHYLCVWVFVVIFSVKNWGLKKNKRLQWGPKFQSSIVHLNV